jgi:hypothetical protein
VGDKEVTDFEISPREVLLNNFMDQLKSLGMNSCILIAHFDTFDGRGNKGVITGENLLAAFRMAWPTLSKTIKQEAAIEQLKKSAG